MVMLSCLEAEKKHCPQCQLPCTTNIPSSIIRQDLRSGSCYTSRCDPSSSPECGLLSPTSLHVPGYRRDTVCSTTSLHPCKICSDGKSHKTGSHRPVVQRKHQASQVNNVFDGHHTVGRYHHRVPLHSTNMHPTVVRTQFYSLQSNYTQ